MTQEEKNLLTKVLLEQLPYNVKVAIDFQPYLACLPDDEDLEYPYRKNLNFILDYDKKTMEDISAEPNILYAYPCNERFQMLRGYTYQEDYGVPVEFIKPYLRPMSSMTEEEYDEFKDLTTCGRWCDDYDRWAHWGVEVVAYEYDETDKPYYNFVDFQKLSDWLNSHHFDYRGLIGKGLALPATEEMYK